MTLKTDVIDVALMGAIRSIVSNEKYFYHSSVSTEYSKLTEEGKEAIAGIVELFGHSIVDATYVDLDTRAKELVINGLTKDY